jgi:hypothetical protein
MPALLEVQRAMRAGLLGEVVDTGNDELLAIHRNTVLSTLVNALRLSFPVVERLVGAEFFAAAAQQFIRGHAPDSAYLNDYGGELPQFLRNYPHASSIPYLADVARLEWAINRALHAPDVPALDPARLANLGAEVLARLSFTVHPALGLLRLQAPADAIWRAVLDQDDAAMAAIDLNEGPVHLLVERKPCGVQLRRLSAYGWQFTAKLSAGRPLFEAFGEGATEELAEIDALLADHLASGRFIDCEGGLRG